MLLPLITFYVLAKETLLNERMLQITFADECARWMPSPEIPIVVETEQMVSHIRSRLSAGFVNPVAF